MFGSNGKGSKKIPSPLYEDWGLHPLSTPHSLILEDFSVKDIQTRSSDFRIVLLLAPSHPELVEGQWLVASFVPDDSGGSVPDLSRLGGIYGVP